MVGGRTRLKARRSPYATPAYEGNSPEKQSRTRGRVHRCVLAALGARWIGSELAGKKDKTREAGEEGNREEREREPSEITYVVNVRLEEL